MVSNSRETPLVFTGSWNKTLVTRICGMVGLHLGEADVSTFADGETKVDLKECMNGRSVVFVQSTSPPTNKHLIELLFMASAAKRSGARHITAIIPYFGYSRQDRKSTEGSNISASDVARMLEIMGVNHVISFDIHSAMCQGFFGPTVRVDNISVQSVFLEHLGGFQNAAVVSPDAGAYARTMKFFDMFASTYPNCHVSTAIIFKQRVAANCIGSVELAGSVVGKDVIIVDDIVDTAGTLCKASELLLINGAVSVTAVITHGVFSGPALERIAASTISRILTTDSVNHSEAVLREPKIKIVSLDRRIAAIVGNS